MSDQSVMYSFLLFVRYKLYCDPVWRSSAVRHKYNIEELNGKRYSNKNLYLFSTGHMREVWKFAFWMSA